MGDSPTQDRQETGAERAPAIYAWAGVALVAVGALPLLAQRFGNVELPSWLYYTAVGAVVLGFIEFALGRMARDAAWEWNKSLLFALGLALLIRWPIAEPYRIPSGSMETTLHGDPNFGRGDRVFVNKWVYGVRYPFLNKRIWYGEAPERWDIVVFKSVEPDAKHPTLVKRIVGMPGDQVHISGGNVYIDGEPLDIPDFMPENQHYTSSGFGMRYGILPDPEYSQIPEGHYLVLGDNSADSRDGRYFGWLPNEHMVGRVACIWWPPPRWRDFTGFSETWWWNTLLVLLGVYVAARLFVGRSWPMVNAARSGFDHVFISFLHYGFRIPLTPWSIRRWGTASAGDTVLYRPVGEAAKKAELLLGRIVGAEGDDVVVEDGTLFVNGHAQTDADWHPDSIAALNNSEHRYGKKGKGKSRVPEGHFFILTDYPEDTSALDSRVMGFVPQERLMGRAQCVWWPLRRAGKLR